MNWLDRTNYTMYTGNHSLVIKPATAYGISTWNTTLWGPLIENSIVINAGTEPEHKEWIEMAGLDLHVVIGNLGAAPELRYLPDGTPVTALKLAVNKKFTRRDGTVVDKTQWYEVTVTGKMAENCVQYLDKGRPVCVVGDGLEVPEWTDRDTGQQRVGKTPRLYAMRVVFLGTNREGGVVEQEYEGSAQPKSSAADYGR
jgi:single-strand DNA-binding protein